jgi:hypothetical protein
MNRALSNTEIVDKLLEHHGLENDNQLAKHYGVERQQIRQFRNGTRVGITQRIITDLLKTLSLDETSS